MLVYILAALVAWLVYYIVSFYRNVLRYPPGPRPLPIIGNMREVDMAGIYRTFARFAPQYGSVYTIFVPAPTVVLTNFEALKEAFITKGDNFVSRPTSAIGDLFSIRPNGGVTEANGEEWKEQRKTAMAILRDMGTSVMEQQVKESINEFLICLDAAEDKDRVDIRFPLQMMIGNVIHETLFGTRYSYDDCKPLIDYIEGDAKVCEEAGASQLFALSMVFPWIRHIPILGYHAVEKFRLGLHRVRYGYIRREVATALEGFDAESDEPRCFAHAYVQRMKTNPMLTNDQLLCVSSDFFLAGHVTTLATMQWALLFLADNQEAQNRMRAEILSVIGAGRMPSMVDKPHLPFTTAVCHEVQRCANVLARNVPRVAEVDTVIQGQLIPKGAYINGDIHALMASDPVFKEPGEFRPERYLNAGGKTINKDLVERTVAFSIGKRACAGEALARMEIFLSLAATVQRYHILPPLDGPIEYEHMPGMFLGPKKAHHLRLQLVA